MNKNKKKIDYWIFREIWLFAIGSFLGLCFETIWAFIVSGQFETRKGLIYSGFIPVYGFGTIGFDILFNKLKKSKHIIIFIVGFVVGSLVEYIASLFLEYVMKSSSWDYSNNFLNINGRITLLYSVCWGVLAVFFVKFVLPLFDKIAEKLDNKWGRLVAIIIAVLLAADMTISILAIRRNSDRLKDIPANNVIENFLDEHYPEDVLRETYPNMKFS